MTTGNLYKVLILRQAVLMSFSVIALHSTQVLLSPLSLRKANNNMYTQLAWNIEGE